MRLSHSLGLSAFSLCAGLVVASGGFTNDIAKIISMLGVGALPASFITYFIADTKSQRLLNDAESKNKKAGETLHKIIRDFDTCKSKLTNANSQLESLKDELKEARNTINSLGHSKLENTGLIAQLQAKLNQLSTQSQKDAQRIEYLESETEQWEFNFKSQVETEANQRFQLAKSQELEKIYHEHDSITSEAMQLFRRLQSWGEKVSHGHESKSQIIKSLAGSYNENLDQVGEAIASERQNYLLQIELLNERIGQLQQQLQGDLIEPVYGDFGFDVNGKIANSIAYDIWQSYKIPLIVNGFEEHEESVSVGYGFSKSLNIQSFLHLLERESKDISTRLGIFQIYDVKSEKTSPSITLKFRRERPKPLNDDEIYKLGLIPSSQFGDRVFLHTDHKTKGKPTLRIMSATGGGKGIATKNIVAYFLTLDNWEIWVSDPLHGSEEDYWHCPKVATSPSESAKAYSEFVKVHKDRQAKRPAITDKFVLGIFDEFDKQHDDDDKKTATEIMTAIRHTKQRQILIGQSGEVGSNHWTWDAMKNCSLLFIEDAIGTAIKHDKDLGWSLAKKREIQRKYEKFTEWAAAKNESQNLSSENAYRIGLIIVGDRYEFLEIPSAHKGILRNGAGIIKDSFPQLEATKDECTKVLEPLEIECSHCHSASFVRHKAHKNSMLHNYKCKSCGKQFTARNNRIS